MSFADAMNGSAPNQQPSTQLQYPPPHSYQQQPYHPAPPPPPLPQAMHPQHPQHQQQPSRDSDSNHSLSPVLSKAKERGRERDSDGEDMQGDSMDQDDAFGYDGEEGDVGTASSNEDEHAALISQALNPDGTPKRPMNAFLLYAKKRRPEISVEQPTMRTGEISKVLSREWSTMSKADKQFFLDQAKRLKDNFNARWPDYVYRRRPNNTKKRRKNAANVLPGSALSPASADDEDMRMHSDDIKPYGAVPSNGDVYRRRSPHHHQPQLTRLAPVTMMSHQHGEMMDHQRYFSTYPPSYPRHSTSSTPTSGHISSSSDYSMPPPLQQSQPSPHAQFTYDQPDYQYTYYSTQQQQQPHDSHPPSSSSSHHQHGNGSWSFDGTAASSSSSSNASPGAHPSRSLNSSHPQLYHSQEMASQPHPTLNHHASHGTLGIDISAPHRSDPNTWDGQQAGVGPVSAPGMHAANGPPKPWAFNQMAGGPGHVGRARRGTYPMPNSMNQENGGPLHSSLQHAVAGVVSPNPLHKAGSFNDAMSHDPYTSSSASAAFDPHLDIQRQRQRQWSTSSGSSVGAPVGHTTSMTRSTTTNSPPQSHTTPDNTDLSNTTTANGQFQALSAPFYPAQPNPPTTAAGMTGGPSAPPGQTGLVSQTQNTPPPAPPSQPPTIITNGAMTNGTSAQPYFSQLSQGGLDAAVAAAAVAAAAGRPYSDSSPSNTTPPLSTPPTPGYSMTPQSGGHGLVAPPMRAGVGISYSGMGPVGIVGEYNSPNGHPHQGMGMGIHGHGHPSAPHAYWERVKSDTA